jgi:hypothetical protein
MKAKNLVIDCADQKEVFRLLDEYKYIGREVDYNLNKLQVTVLALPRDYKKKRDANAKAAAKRETQEEEYDPTV